MTKVLFIYPNVIKAIQEQLGIAYLSAMLKSNRIETKLYDYTFHNDDENNKDLVDIMKSYRPDFIAVSALSSNYYLGLKLAKICKELDSNVKILFGGVHPTLVPREVINIPFIDAVFIGESDFSLLEYLLYEGNNTNIDGAFIKDIDNKKNNNLKITYNNYTTTPDLDIIDNIIDCKPDHGLFMRHFYKDFHGNKGILGMFMTSRGCPYKCTYCCNHMLSVCYKNGRWTRFRKIENVIREIEYSIKLYHTDHIYFADDTFTMKKNHIIEFCSEYKKHIYIPFYCMIRADTINDSVMKSLANAGCKIVLIGIESGVERIRNSIYNKCVTNDQIIDSINLAHKYGIKTISFNMIGAPTETIDDMENTLKLNIICNIDDAKMTILAAFPHTKLWKSLTRGEYPGYKISDDIPVNYYEGTNIISPNMTTEELINFQNHFYNTIREKRVTN